MKKRLLAFMLSICVAITMLPAAFAVENEDSKYDNDSDIQGIMEIDSVFGDNTISKQVNDTNASADYTTAVSSYSELQSRLEALESKYVGTTWTKYYYGRECKGFASFTFNNLFCNGYIGKTGSNNYTIPTLNSAYSIGTSTNIDANAAKSLLSQSDIGDFIQVRRRSLGKPHSMIVAGVDDNGIWIFDCNASSTYCLVQKYYQTWSTFASKNISVSVYRATNYPLSTPSISYITNTKYCYLNTNSINLTWTKSNNSSSYWINVWRGDEHVFNNSVGNCQSYSLNCFDRDGVYAIQVDAMNSFGEIAEGGFYLFYIYHDVVDLGDSFYATIYNSSNGNVVTNDYNNVSGRKYTGEDNQKWFFQKNTDDGSYIISNVSDGKKLTAKKSICVSSEDLWREQLWHIKDNGYGDYYLQPESNIDMAFELVGASEEEGANIQLYERHKDWASQRFCIQKFTRYGDFSDLGNEFYAVIRNSKAKTYITDMGDDVQGYHYTGENNQVWKFSRSSNGSYSIQSVETKKYLMIDGASDENKTNIFCGSYQDGAKQKWFLYGIGSSYVIWLSSSHTHALELCGADSNDRTAVQLWEYHEDWESQQFEIINVCNHNWCNEIVNIQPTCIISGERIYTCSICGETRTEIIPATGHTLGDWQIDNANHVKQRFCVNCDYSESEDIPITIFSITSQPTNFTGEVGETATFTVKATGSNLTYQWQYANAGTDYWRDSSQSGNKTATLSVPITAAREGQKYRVVITDGNGNTVTSNAATLITKPVVITITTQPLDYTDTIGKTATFTVKATGNSLTYQWQYANAGQEDAWRDSSQTGNKTVTLSVPITAARDGQKYRVVITDGSGNTVTSNAVTLHVGTVLAITSQPVDYTGAVGTTATFTVKATGSDLTYQWQYANAGQEDAWRASSQTGNKTATLSVPITAARDGQKYRVVITDGSGNTVTSNAATLHAGTVLAITSQPVDYTGAVGTTATFTVKATGNSLTYQWQYANAGQEDVWRNSSQTGNKTTTLTVPITAARDGQKYRVVITDANGNVVTSNVATLKTKPAAITITTQPSSYTGTIGTTATFTVKATGDGLTYQWQYANAGQEDAWRASSQTGNKTATLSVPITAARNGQKYRVVITDANGNVVTSNAATLKVS